MERAYSFEPIFAPDCRLLILGSLPGIASLNARRYYQHPRNLFWDLIARITESTVPEKYDDKVRWLLHHSIGLWDVLQSGYREGSADAAIQDPLPNDIPSLIGQLPYLQCIAFNGQTAFHYLKKFFSQSFNPFMVVLPSSSPANARQSLQHKFNLWEQSLKPFIHENKYFRSN